MGVGTRRGLGAAAISALLAVALHGSACASTAVVSDAGGFAHPARGWRVGAPDAGWTRASVDGADLAFRGPGGAWMSLASRCGIRRPDPRVLVRHLAIGLPERTLVRDGALRVGGSPGWSQTWRTRASDAELEVEASSVVTGDCVYDFVLVSPPSAPGAAAAFERWRESFRPSDAAATAAGARP